MNSIRTNNFGLVEMDPSRRSFWKQLNKFVETSPADASSYFQVKSAHLINCVTAFQYLEWRGEQPSGTLLSTLGDLVSGRFGPQNSPEHRLEQIMGFFDRKADSVLAGIKEQKMLLQSNPRIRGVFEKQIEFLAKHYKHLLDDNFDPSFPNIMLVIYGRAMSVKEPTPAHA